MGSTRFKGWGVSPDLGCLQSWGVYKAGGSGMSAGLGLSIGSGGP